MTGVAVFAESPNVSDFAHDGEGFSCLKRIFAGVGQNDETADKIFNAGEPFVTSGASFEARIREVTSFSIFASPA